ncbi:MAG: RNA 2',3'-cyclic phosphodiesterase [Candidatus Magasanikbacteria bacterium]
MPKKYRIFIAFPVSDEVREELLSAQNKLVELNKKSHIKWTKRDLFHITLEFIGDAEAYQVEGIMDALSKISKNFHAFDYWLDRLDEFPNKSQPNILVAKVKGEKRANHAIHDKLSESLQELGLLDVLHDWTPHVTIGRNRNQEDIVGLGDVELKKVIWNVNSIQLIESRLTSSGPIYDVIETYNLIGN